MAELSSLVFATDTTELERASRAIASLVQDMSQVSVASANMARISAQTEQILARAATESAKARKENAKAADIEIKTIIAADKADAARAESIRKAAEAERRRTEATGESTRATRRNVDILQRQNDIYEFLAEGFSKGQASILATAKAAGQLSDELKGVLEAQKQFTSDSFDQSETGLKRLLKTTKEVTDANGFFLEGFDLTTKQARELSNDLDRLNASLTAQGKSYQEITNAQAIYKQQFIDEAAVVNRANAALDAITKQRREVVSATDYMTTAEQKMAAALNTSNAAIDRSGTDLLVKYEAALRKSGVAQDVATQKLAAYKAQLVQVQGQEQKRREDHLTRGLAPQATDIAVSLWSGQNPLTVLLQQGGQINDMFMQSGVAAEDFAKVVRESLASMVPAMMTVATGIGEVLGGMFVDAGKSVLDFISDITGISAAVEQAQRWIVSAGEANFRWIGVMQRFGETATKVMAVGLLALVTTMVAVAMKYKEIIQSENELSKALALNGGAMDMTKESAIAYADSMKQVGIGNLKAQESMTAFINAGAMGAETMDAAREAAVALEKYAGIALSDTAKEFAKLQDEPSKALIEIAKNTGQVEKATLDVISALEDEQGASAAAAAATVYAADAKKKAADEIKASLSPIETLWHDIKSAIGQVGQAIYDLSKSEKTINVLRTMWQAFAVTVAETWYVLKQTGITLGGIAAGYAAFFSGDFEGARNIGKDMKEGAAAARAEHDKLIASIMSKGDVEEKQHTKKKAQNSEYAKWLEDNAKALAKSQSKEEEFATKKKQLQADLKKGLIDEVKYNEALVGWKRVIMGEDKKPKAAPKDTFYETSMAKYRDASIAASDATKELTKSQIELMQTVADPKFLALSKQKQNDILQSGAAAIAIEKQKEAVIDLQKAEEFRDKILGKSEGLGKDYYAQMEALPKHAAALNLTTEQTDELIRKIYQGTPVWQNYNKSLEQADEALRKFTESSIAYQASTNAENQELDHRISLLGKTAEEQRKLQIEYQRETKINATRVELEKKLRDIAKERAEAEGKGVRDTKKLQEFADAEVQAQQDAAERIKVINKGVAVEYASDLDKEIAAIRGGISDSIVTALFEGGKEGSKKLRSVIVDALRNKFTIVVDAVVNTLMGNVVGSITGASATASTLGAAGDAGSLLSAGSALSSLGAFGGAVSGFGTAALSAAQTMVGMTGTVAQMTTSLAAAGHTAASGLAAGVNAFAAIPGWGWALAGVGLLAGSGLGKTRGANHGGGLYSSLGQTNQEAAKQLTGKLGWKDPEEDFTKRGNTELNKQVESTVKGLLELYNGLGKLASGTVKELEIVAGFATNSKYDDEASYGYFQILEKATGELLKEYTNRDMEKDGGKAWEQYVADLGTAMVTELRSSDIPSWMDGILKELGDAPTLESFQKAVVEIHKIDQAFSMFSKNIDGFAGMGDEAQSALLKAAGGFDALAASANSYYDTYYTDAEKLANVTRDVQTVFTDLGLEMPTTQAGFRKLVEEQMALGVSGTEATAKLLGVNQAFAQITPSADAALTEIQKFKKTSGEVNSVFATLGLAVPKTQKEFTALVAKYKEMGEAGKDVHDALTGVNSKFVELDISAKSLAESVGISASTVEKTFLDAMLGSTDATQAGEDLAKMVTDGVYNSIAGGFAEQLSSLMMDSIINPVITAALTGTSISEAISQSAIDNMVASAQAAATALNAILNDAGFKQAIADITATIKGAVSGAAGGGGGSGGGGSGGGGGSLFGMVGSAGNNQGEELIPLKSHEDLVSQTLDSNKKVSELLQKLLNPKKEYKNRYLALGGELEDKRLEAKVDEYTSNGLAGLHHLISLGTVPEGESFDSILAKAKEWASDPAIANVSGRFNQYLSSLLGLDISSNRMLYDMSTGVAWNLNAVKVLEKDLREWYLAQARLIALEDMQTLATETVSANEKTAELKRTGGIEDPITKLKESLHAKMQAIDEGIGAALMAEVELLRETKIDPKLDKTLKDAIESKKTYADSLTGSNLDKTISNLELQIANTQKFLHIDNMANWGSAAIYTGMAEILQRDQAALAKIKDGSALADALAGVEGAEQALLDAIVAATNPAKQQELLDEIAKYKGGITEWYKAQAELLSTEMLVDINKQIKELEASEKGPLTTIKDAIQKYIDDFTELGTLTADVQTAIDKLSDLQLTKARKSLYDQLLSPEELKTRDTLALTSEFSKLGKVIPDSTSSLRAMIDAANAAGNTTLADSLLELVPAFIALQDGADGVGDALSKLRSDTDDAYAALERAVEAQRKVLNDLITNLRAVFDAAKAGAKTLYKEVDSVKRQSAEAGNLFINEALKALRLNGAVPDSKELQDAMDASIQGVTDAQYETAFDEMRGRLVLAGKLTEIADLTEPQLTLAEKQLKDLDQILETARAQIDELRGINTSVLSVSTAISNLASAIAAEAAARPPVPPGGGSGGGASAALSEVDRIYNDLFGRSAETAGGAYWLSTGLTGDALQSAIAAGALGSDLTASQGSLPGFAQGINLVPYDMQANIHAGESIIPAEFNPFNPSASTPLSLTPLRTSSPNSTKDNSDIIEENRLLRQELQAQNGAMVRLLSKVARVVERWDGDGLPEPRTETA